MPVEGVIAERARGILPVTWDALQRDPRFGDDLLQAVVDTSKDAVTGNVVLVEIEPAYPLIVIDFIAKVVALNLIPAGIDFWMNQPQSESATGTNENHTFVDRAATLEKLRDALLEETREKADEIADILGYTRSTTSSVPRINTLDELFLTPSPQEFPRPYAETSRS